MDLVEQDDVVIIHVTKIPIYLNIDVLKVKRIDKVDTNLVDEISINFIPVEIHVYLIRIIKILIINESITEITII